jgi:SpoVK/Ycf46/Vps4 family AAA+-type ATPase
LLGLSGADISFIAREAAYNCIRRNVDTNKAIIENIDIDYKNILINEDDFNKALEQLREKNEKPENYIL